MIRVVLDTNILVSGILGFERMHTPPVEIWERWHNKEYVLVISQHILDELQRTLSNTYFSVRIPPDKAEQAVETILKYAWIEDPAEPLPGMATHPEDDLILATAMSASVDYLITGDRQLLALEHVDSMAIVSAREFVDILTAARQ